MTTTLNEHRAASGVPDQGNEILIATLKGIVGDSHVLTSPEATLRFRTGFRFGRGSALAVVQPGSLVEQWKVLQACAAADKIIIMQAANTGLTGGSTPDGDDYDREIVIISTLRMAKVYLIEEGRQVVCLPGATLYQLEQVLRPLGREPHSVIGSSCIGASVFGGVCNNSGGALIQRGPAYTQMTLYARIDETGKIELINHLGIRLGNDPETILKRLDDGDLKDTDVDHDPSRFASDHDYIHHVRDIEADTPARFNADPKRLFEASGSAGKVMLFAVRLDTFEREEKTAVFYIGTNDPAELTEIRRHILAQFKTLPVSGEYMHRDAFDIAETYGKDTFLAIRALGTDRLPKLFAWKAKFDVFVQRYRFLPQDLSDKIMQAVSRLFPSHLPPRMKDYRDRFEHHLMLKMAGPGIEEARTYLRSIFPSAKGHFFECTPEEGVKAFLHRFATAGAAIRYRAIHRQEVEDIVALDIALRRNDRDWIETLPPAIDAPILHKLYYGHFFCYVFHQDYIVKKGHDTLALEHEMWTLLDERGAQYPAEHNVGHLYHAKPALVGHYKNLDPCNTFNPGIGHTSKHAHWR
ncbi:D-lactate dehydrogenase [Beijerinckia indica]|uniref:Quinone-dependent D-lactate dehydrogenase n=1 Tax=Beijerinckia indica subsp. indica (strain ATCC 9039 / DSM 1715 / NCIMB 8712) TaxID=395963 RepID=B2IER8_BEII9|nr:D-lactate dehydrogenase [Beijerinckia indica]ACB97008.1 D-lactate dehydrogenase [Beijerinckia indica subsp. indica ATCC 9039]